MTEEIDTAEIARRMGMTRNAVCMQIKRGVRPEDVRPRGRGAGGGKNKTHASWDLPIEQHQEARIAIDVAAELGGLTAITIATLLGISTSRVNWILRQALAKVVAGMPGWGESQ